MKLRVPHAIRKVQSVGGSAGIATVLGFFFLSAISEKGYEWYIPEKGDISYYRVIGSDEDWVKFEN